MEMNLIDLVRRWMSKNLFKIHYQVSSSREQDLRREVALKQKKLWFNRFWFKAQLAAYPGDLS